MDNALKNFIDSFIKNDTDTAKITVLPLPCGVGKSQYITYLLSDALIRNYGLIVVTDTIERLNKYVSACYDDDGDLIAYIQRNADKISILTADNFKAEIDKTKYKPIVLMSTQRYFNLSKEDILKFTSGQQHKRTKIIFDEKINLLESRRLTVKSLNNIATALKEALDNTIDQADKATLINEYSQLNVQLQSALNDNERQNIDTQNFKREIYFDSKNVDIDIDKFYTLVDKYKQQLNKYNPDVLKDVYSINKLLFDGFITSQKTKSKRTNNEYQRYNNYFTVVTNNTDKLLNIGAKVFVLDGTADISPEYMLNCVNMVDCKDFKKDLSNLTINIVNVNTSKDRLLKNDEKTNNLIQAIIDYIKALPLNIDTVFTYKDIESKFKNDFKNVEHLGNIKGRNDFRSVNNIVQVGLNRISELLYYLYANEIYYFNDNDKSIIKRIYAKETIDNIRCRMILADIEQNIFRCKIRNGDNKEKCNYTLLFNTTEPSKLFDGKYQPLVEMIKKRYEVLGAVINVIDEPIEFKLFKTIDRKESKDTNPQKIVKWLSSKRKDYLFHISELKSDLHLTDKQLERLKRKNFAIKELFQKMKTNKKGYYRIN